MSRHRNIRNIDYDEERDDFDDVYGRSMEEDLCVSPSTERTFMYTRQKQPTQLSSYFGVPGAHSSAAAEQEPNSSRAGVDMKALLSGLSQHDQALLLSCVDCVRNVVGDQYTDEEFVEAAIESEFDVNKCLNFLLGGATPAAAAKTPQDSKPEISLPKAVATGGHAGEQQQKAKGKESTVRGKATSALISANHVSNIAAGKAASNLQQQELRSNTPSKTKSKNSAGSSGHDAASSERVRTPSDQLESGDHSLPGQRNTNSTNASPMPGASPRRPPSKKQVSSTTTTEQRLARTLEEQKRREEKPVISTVVVGHVDAGKSTLMGHLLYLLQEIDEKTMRKTEHEARKVGKQSFSFAWALDETEEERSRGITMDIAHAKFETPNRRINLLDAPGHKDFIPNMISGAAQADTAVLVVDATTGEFESGFDLGGQTREHVILLRSLGVHELIVAVNKLDNVVWSQERFDDIVSKLNIFLKHTGFRSEDFTYVPVSGLDGANLIVKSPNLAWYDGPTLAERINQFKVPQRAVDKSLRLAVMDVFRSTFGSSDTCIAGRVLQGALHLGSGEAIMIQPAGEFAWVKSIFINGEPVDVAIAGDYVTLSLVDVDAAHITIGSVLCDSEQPCKVVSSFRARIAVFTPRMPLTKSMPVILFQQTSQESAFVRKIVSQLDKKTGEVEKQRPRVLPRGSAGEIIVNTTRPVCVELFSDSRDLGRFTLRSEGETIAAGIVTAIE